jgi:hypothetical protein
MEELIMDQVNPYLPSYFATKQRIGGVRYLKVFNPERFYGGDQRLIIYETGQMSCFFPHIEFSIDVSN